MRIAAAVLVGVGCYRVWVVNFGEQQETRPREIVRGLDSNADQGQRPDKHPSAAQIEEMPSVEMLAMLDFLPYLQLGEGDAELEAFTQLDETSPITWGFDSTSSEVLDGWDGWDEPSAEAAR